MDEPEKRYAVWIGVDPLYLSVIEYPGAEFTTKRQALECLLSRACRDLFTIRNTIKRARRQLRAELKKEG